jgi:transmembrane sensor
LDKDRPHILISRFLAKEASEEESKELFQLLESSPEHRRQFEEMRSLWDETIVSSKLDSQSLVREKLLAEINREGSNKTPAIQHHRKHNMFYRMMVAASLALVLMVGYFVYQNQKPTEGMPVALVPEIIKTNPIGQKSRIFLPDGSNIWLNAESTIRYGQNFRDSARNIYLEGEAYFEVVSHPIPFVVHYGDLTVTALGTSFNVSAYPREEKIIVALVEGKVAVQRGAIEEVLNPNELFIIGNYDNKGNKYSGNAFEFSSWKDGILTFKSDPLEDVIAKIERWYGVEVVVEGLPDANLRFTGRFHNEYLKNILESMSYGQNMRFQIINKKVKLMFN